MKSFYRIQDNSDGTVDVYLTPAKAVPVQQTDGKLDFSFQLLAIRGVVPFPDMESDIRKRYDDWCASAEVIEFL